MAQPVTQDRETEHSRQDPAPAAAPEPATSRALWPTFMRRTLAEEALRRHSEPAGAK
jgi:hypothetical protein